VLPSREDTRTALQLILGARGQGIEATMLVAIYTLPTRLGI